MADVQIGRCRVKARLDDQLAAALELGLEPVVRQNLVRATYQFS